MTKFTGFGRKRIIAESELTEKEVVFVSKVSVTPKDKVRELRLKESDHLLIRAGKVRRFHLLTGTKSGTLMKRC
jgi:hypothetical protein